MSTDLRKKSAPKQAKDEKNEFAADPGKLKAFPVLADWLCRIHYEGDEVKSATLGIWAEDGAWKCRLTDRESGNTIWLTIDEPEHAFTAVESALNEEYPPWRQDKRSWGGQKNS